MIEYLEILAEFCKEVCNSLAVKRGKRGYDNLFDIARVFQPQIPQINTDNLLNSARNALSL